MTRRATRQRLRLQLHQLKAMRQPKGAVMDGNLLTLHEAAAYLFGEDTVATYKRTWRLIKSNDVQTISSGKKIYVARAVLDDVCGISGVPSAGQGLRDSAWPIRDQKGDSGGTG